MTIEDLTGGIISAARANHIPYIQAHVADALWDGPKTNQEIIKLSNAPSAALSMQEKHACVASHADVAREVQSALAALQTAGVAAQLFGAEVLLALASSGDKDRWDMLVQQKAASIVCERVASGKLQEEACVIALRALEALARKPALLGTCSAADMLQVPKGCTVSMLGLLSSTAQPASVKLQAAQLLTTLLENYECQRNEFREAGGIVALASLLPDSKNTEIDEDASVDQMRQILRALQAAVAADSQSREAAGTKLDVLVRIARLIAHDKTAGEAVDVAAALVEYGPGERSVGRACCLALCQAGAAQPLLKMITGEPQRPSSIKAMQVIRKMALSGPRQLAMLREAHCLESCIHLVKHAPLDSIAANLAVTLLREFAEWDSTSRAAILKLGGHMDLLQALHAAEFEEAAIVHDIAEALGRLCDDKTPDNSSTGGKKLLHWAAQFGDLGLVRRLLENNPVSDFGDSRGNSPLHLAVLNNHTVVVKEFLAHNADVLACNSQGKWSLDMAAPKSDVWHMLYKEIQWRSFLEQRRQCHLILEGWEGPGECSFSPLLAILFLERSSAGTSKPAASSLQRLLRVSTGRKGSAGKAQLPCELRMPHTTSIKVMGGTAVEINFMATDPILGHCVPARSADGKCHVQQLVITLTQPSDATELHRALALMQERAHPEILEFAKLLQDHLILYEQQKAAQLDARLQLHAISQELLASFQASLLSICGLREMNLIRHVEAEEIEEVQELHARLVKLVEQVEGGRDAVLAFHRAVLDYADSSIARLGTLRVECEKREASGGDESWLALGERALASLHTVRAYRERALQAAYCGLLPPSPCQLEDQIDRGGGLLDLDDQRLLRALVPGNNMSVARSPPKLQIHTDLELVQALQSLREECEGLLAKPGKLKKVSKPKVARPPKALPQPEPAMPPVGPPSTPDKPIAAAVATSQRTFTTPVPASSDTRSALAARAKTVRPTVLAHRFGNADLSGPLSQPHHTSAAAPSAATSTGAQNKIKAAGSCAKQQAASESDGALVSDDNLSMTGLVDSHSENSSDDEMILGAPNAMRGGVSAAAGSGSEDSDSSATYRRQAHAFIQAAPLLAAPVMQARGDSEHSEQQQQSAPDHATQISVAVAGSEEHMCEDASDSDESEASLGSTLAVAAHPTMPSLALPECGRKSSGAQGLLEADELESRRSGSFTFAPVSARTNDTTAFAARRRATSSEPCEALSFPRLGSPGPSHLRHGSSMPSSQAKVTVPASTTSDSTELQGDVSPLAQRLLESGLSSGDWAGHAAHNDLSQALAESLKVGPGSTDGMQELIALLGSTEWPQGGVTAEAELANAVASISGPNAVEGKAAGLQTAGQKDTSEVPETPATAAEPKKKRVDAEVATLEPEEELWSSEPAQDRAELMHGLTAEIAAAAQKAAQDAISSSLQVAGDAVRELPTWAGPDVIIAATMSKLDGIVAAASAQVADAIETGVARAAAMASSMSADALAQRLAEHKRAADESQPPQQGSPPASPRSPGLSAGTDGAVMTPGRGPISARFPAFAQRSRGSSPSTSRHASQAEEVHAPLGVPQPQAMTGMQDMEAPAIQDSLAPLRQAAGLAAGKEDTAALSAQQEVNMAPQMPHATMDYESNGGNKPLHTAQQSPTKMARAGGAPPHVPVRLHDSLTAGLDVAILSAMAVPRAASAPDQDLPNTSQTTPRAFRSGEAEGAAAPAKVSPRSRKAASRAGSNSRGRRARPSARPAPAASAIMEPLSGGTSSCGSAQLAVAGQEFTSALFDSDASSVPTLVQPMCAESSRSNCSEEINSMHSTPKSADPAAGSATGASSQSSTRLLCSFTSSASPMGTADTAGSSSAADSVEPKRHCKGRSSSAQLCKSVNSVTASTDAATF
ncbi:probable Ankyrin repeat domain-containing protein 54 at N-terminal half [Coccomyxa sp. Obi]|nr:probable Ankyrin repeat domain-containing protein 54 at N-terminal half [Coccomyxa sp. Obi]